MYFSSVKFYMKNILNISRLALLISVFLCIATGLQAQQQVELTQNLFNILSYNPGYAGHRNAISATGTFRRQWVGFGSTKEVVNSDGTTEKATTASPMTVIGSVDAFIRPLHGGVGLSVTNDQIGLFNNTLVNLGYAYQINFAGGGRMGIGAQVQFENIVLDQSGLIWGDEGDPIAGQMANEGNDFMVDCNFGIYYSKPNSFFGGISAYNLVATQGKSTLYKNVRSFNVHGGYEIRFPANPTFKLVPSVLVKTDLASFQVDAGVLAYFKNMFWLGANYRINDGLGIIAGMMWKDFLLGYSYDITMSKMALGGSWGSHEVVLSYSFKFERDKGKITQKNTRYL